MYNSSSASALPQVGYGGFPVPSIASNTPSSNANAISELHARILRARQTNLAYKKMVAQHILGDSGVSNTVQNQDGRIINNIQNKSPRQSEIFTDQTPNEKRQKSTIINESNVSTNKTVVPADFRGIVSRDMTAQISGTSITDEEVTTDESNASKTRQALRAIPTNQIDSSRPVSVSSNNSNADKTIPINAATSNSLISVDNNNDSKIFELDAVILLIKTERSAIK